MSIKSLTMFVPRTVNPTFAFNLIEDMVNGEGGDGWAWIVCEDPHEIVEEFIKRKDDYYIVSESKTNISVQQKREQSVWNFSTLPPTPEDLITFDFIFELK